MKQNNRKKPQKKQRPGCIFWIALILLMIAISLFSHKKIGTVLSDTGFLSLFGTSSDKSGITPDIRRISGENTEGSDSNSQKDVAELQVIEVEQGDAESDNPQTPEISEETEEVAVTPRVETAPESFKVRDSALYFIVIQDDGSTKLKKTVRSVRFTDSPLTSTISSLLSGVSSSEISYNFISLIPEKTRLNRLWIKDGTAFIDFSENFLFNSFGREGYIGQLRQIIYTATEFPTVTQVQIVIDGEIKNYLGSEGIYIGKPLTRESF